MFDHPTTSLGDIVLDDCMSSFTCIPRLLPLTTHVSDVQPRVRV